VVHLTKENYVGDGGRDSSGINSFPTMFLDESGQELGDASSNLRDHVLRCPTDLAWKEVWATAAGLVTFLVTETRGAGFR
jgi:hypothetical protein